MNKKNQIIIMGGAGVGFALVTFMVITSMTENWDMQLAAFVYERRLPGLTTFTEAITHIGDWEAIVCICLLLLLYPATGIRYGIPVISVVVLTTAIKTVVKFFVARPRPQEAYHLIHQAGYSYPSGHAITSAAICIVLIILVHKFWKVSGKKVATIIAMAMICLAIGLSRIYLGVHFPTDVLGGWLAGIACAITVMFFWEKWLKTREINSIE